MRGTPGGRRCHDEDPSFPEERVGGPANLFRVRRMLERFGRDHGVEALSWLRSPGGSVANDVDARPGFNVDADVGGARKEPSHRSIDVPTPELAHSFAGWQASGNVGHEVIGT